MDPETFGQKLATAAELNITRPWPESQNILDDLRPHLRLASREQYAQFVYLNARNQSLSGDLAGALDQVQRALEQDPPGDWRLRLNRLGANIAVIARRFEDAFAMLGDALALLEQPRPDGRDEGVYSLASYVYTRVGEIARARRYGELAIEVALHRGDQRGLCMANQSLAYTHKVAGALESAQAHYQQARENCLESGDEMLVGVTEAGFGDLLRMRGETARAEDLFASALPRLERADFESGLAEAWLYLARLESARGNDARVEELLRASIRQFEAEENWEYLAETHRILAGTARARGSLAQALDHYDMFMQAREQHLDMVRARQLAFLEVEFDMQYKDQQLALLREQARVSQLEVETQRQRAHLTVFGYGIAVFLVIVLGLLLIHATRERRRFQGLSHRDGLTGVNNHTRFFELAAQQLQDCRLKQHPYTLVVADIDHFKRVNDQFGHAFGDEILRAVGSRLRESFGEYGVIGRIGGEEFAISMPGMRPEDAHAPITRFRKAMSETRAGDQTMPVTLSFGLAEPRHRSESLNALRERADQAL
ncbi:MAG: diguanylate cyclase, partial [Wenzhouxiangellaceae bacterium]